MRRTVGARLRLTAQSAVTAELRVTAAPADGLAIDESLTITGSDGPIEPDLVLVPGEGWVHRFRAPAGPVAVDYAADVAGTAAPQVVTAGDEVVYLRPSRYAESDALLGTARSEFAGITGAAELLRAVSSWVGQRLAYVPGSSRPTDGAVTTMLQREGVCRDYAHLVVALLRALEVPARVAAVYGPGLDPMDFHAVAEAAVDGRWCVTDATLLAPRPSLLRIGTGRDAADTAFLSTYGGNVALDELTVTATADVLPTDDLDELVALG